MNQIKLIELNIAVVNNLLNVFKLLGQLDTQQLEDVSPQLMISPAAELAREVGGQTCLPIEIQDIYSDLYLHIYVEKAEAAKSEDPMTDAIAAMEKDVYKVHSAAHDLFQELCKAQEKFGL